MYKIKKNTGFIIFLYLVCGTEFFYIDVGFGALRLYHVFMPLIIFMHYKHWGGLVRIPAVKVLIVFFAINIMSIILSKSPVNALLSTGYFLANAGISFAVALMLISSKVDVKKITEIALKVALISISVGVMQLMIFKGAGINLGLSESQSIQLQAGFSSGLRTEANTFAKYLNVIFLLYFPVISLSKNKLKIYFIFAVLTFGMLLSLTRSALYGLAITMLVYYVWQLNNKDGRVFRLKYLIVAVWVFMALIVYYNLMGGVNEYAIQKLNLFFDSDEIVDGGSSGFRLLSQSYLFESFIDSTKSIIIGNGWGQVYFDYGGQLVQAGGGDVITILAYTGILGMIVYLILLHILQGSANAVFRQSLSCNDKKVSIGVRFALIGLFITGFINGSLAAPEYWLVVGVAIYYGYVTGIKESKLIKK